MNNAEELVEVYLTLRQERERIKALFDSKDNELKADMAKIESALHKLCEAAGASGLRTQFGTVSRQIKERYFCTDWDNFRKFVETEGSMDLLERRISQRNFKEFMAGREHEGLPPGVNAMREYDIVVRKAASQS